MTDIRTHASRWGALRVALVLLSVLAAARPAAADTINLQWDLNSEPDVTGYIVYVGTQSGVYSQTIDVGNTDTYAFTSAVAGQRYYFAVVAYNAGSLVSQLSNEVSSISNSYPVLTNPGSQTGRVGQAASLTLLASDADGAALTYSATGLPSGLTISPSLGVISGTPTTPGTYSVTASASDGVLATQQTFSWVVLNAVQNTAPTLVNPGTQSGGTGQQILLQLQAVDADGDALTYSASGLPAGLQIASATGRITGTLTTAGSYSVTASVSDGLGTASQSFSWTVAPANVAPTLAAVANQSGTVGQAASLQLQGSDANGNALTYAATGLPPGLTITASTGLIAGTPTTAGTYTVTATVSDGALSASRTFTWTIAAANVAPALALVANQSGTVGQAASLQLQGSDANGNTLTYAATGLPPGLTITASTGLIAGTPTTAGSSTVTATVSDGVLSASRTFTWTIAAANVAPTLAAVANQSGTVGQAASLQLQGSDANGNTLTYAATGLPPGLTITASTGLIAGTPTTAGTYTVTATVTDGALSANRTFTWTIAAANVAPTLAAVANQSGTVGQATSLQLQGSDANGNTLTYSGTGLPPGLTTTASTGLIAGTPTTAGTYTVTATVTDGALSANRTFTWTIAAANVAPTLAAVANQSGTVGQATSLQLQGSDANGNTLTYTATGLPSGLSITASTGLIAGTPTTAGTYNVTATVTDGALSANRTFTWTIAAANVAPALAVVANQSGTVGQAASLQLQGSDANGNTLTYAATGLPPGLTITASTGLIAGTPATAGTYAVTATVSDGALSASRTFTWTIAPANVAPTLAAVANQSGTVGQAASLQLQGSDANSDVLTYSATGLPAGLSMTASTGVIAGTLTTAGTYNVTATVSDGALSANRTFTWTIAAANMAPTLAGVANQSGTVGHAMSLQLQGSDASGDVLTYSATGLPPGLTITASTGLIAGTPTTAGTYTVTATVSDGTLSASRSFSWTISAANGAPTLAPIGSQSGTVGQAVSLQLQGSDANSDVLTYVATGLPSGLSITASTGLIAGTPTTAGTYAVTATVTDGALSANRTFTWSIAGANVAPTLAVVANQSGTVGQAASLQLQGSDANVDVLTYAATGLPPGLTIAPSTGLIAGTPTTAGTYAVTATVTDGALSANRTFTWTIAAVNVAPTLAVVANQSGTVGQAASLQLQGSDANSDVLTYSATGLPSGLSITASTGLIAGTPTTAGTHTVTATVTDGVLSANRTFTWTIAAANVAPTLAAVANQSGTVGQAASLQLQGSDANSDVLTYSATGLPPGLSITASTGAIAGTPTTAGTYAVTATVTDGALSANRTFTWTIAAANVAPTLAVVANQSGTVGQAASLQLQGSDANGNTLTYAATGLPPGLTITASTGLIAGTPTTAGTHTVTAAVSDGTLSANRTFTWTIAAANVAPTLAAVANQSGTVGENASLQLQGGDVNNDVLTYSATGLPPGLTMTASTGVIAGTPTTAGTYNVTVTVSDGALSSQASFVWTVASVAMPAPLSATSTQPVPDSPAPVGEAEVRSTVREPATRVAVGTAATRPTSATETSSSRQTTGTTAMTRTGVTPVSTATQSSTGTPVGVRSVATETGSLDGSYTGTAAVSRESLTRTSTAIQTVTSGSTTTRSIASEPASTTTETQALTNAAAADCCAAGTPAGSLETSEPRRTAVSAPAAAPIVMIETPVDRATFALGTPVIFSAIARDLQDGDLSARVVWTSSREGGIGTGSLLHKELGAGTHIITASVTDGSGNRRSAQVTIVVAKP